MRGLCVLFVAILGGAELVGQEVGTAEIVGPKVISTELPEFATSFHPSGQTMYFNRTDAARKKIRLFQARKTDSGWSDPIPLAFSNGTWRDLDPFVAPDGRYLYFSSNRPTDGAKGVAGFNTWRATLDGDGNVGTPELLPTPLNSEDDEIFVSVTRGGTFYFSVFEQGGGRGVYRCRRQGGAWVRERVDLPGRAGNPAIHPDGEWLVFVSNAPDGKSSDLFLAKKEGPGFSTAKHLGSAINTQWAEFAPGWHGDWLFFTSERPGIVGEVAKDSRPPGDIYRVRFKP